MAQSRHHLTQAKEMARHSVSQPAHHPVAEVLRNPPPAEAIKRVITGAAERYSGANDHHRHAQPLASGSGNDTHPRRTRGAGRCSKNTRKLPLQFTLSYMGDVLMLDVQDNGIGLDNAALQQGRRLRADGHAPVARLAGLTVESEPGEGLRLVIPVHSTDRAASILPRIRGIRMKPIRSARG